MFWLEKFARVEVWKVPYSQLLMKHLRARTNRGIAGRLWRSVGKRLCSLHDARHIDQVFVPGQLGSPDPDA